MLLDKLGLPLRFALLGAVAALTGYGLSLVIAWDMEAPGCMIVAAGAIGGFIGGWIRQRRGK